MPQDTSIQDIQFPDTNTYCKIFLWEINILCRIIFIWGKENVDHISPNLSGLKCTFSNLQVKRQNDYFILDIFAYNHCFNGIH